MKKFNFSILFMILSLGWLGFFGYNFFRYQKTNREITEISESLKHIDDIKFIERNVNSLQSKYESASRNFFSKGSTSEFIAKLPKIAELSGIHNMKMENLGVKMEDSVEVTELRISTESMFPDVANFIDILERSKLPIQVSSLKMNYKNNTLYSSMVIRIYKKMIKD